MQSTLRPYTTAGAAIVGAGLIAVIPMAAPLPHINTVRDVTLTAGPGEDAFTLDGTTFDPMTSAGGEGFNLIDPLSTAPPLLSLGGGTAVVNAVLKNFGPQTFDVYSGTGSNATDLGSIGTGTAVANLLGLPNTEFTVTGYNVPAGDLVTAFDDSDISFTGAGFSASDLVNALENPVLNTINLTSGDLTGTQIFFLLSGSSINLSAAGIDADDVASVVNGAVDAYGADAGLPDLGVVYDVLNLGNGTYNVYVATPGDDGTVTDTLVTPFGNINLDSLFGGINAANPLQPGDAFTGLQAGDSAIGADAFTIGTTTFDPTTFSGAEGFNAVHTLAGVPPLLNIGGGMLLGNTVPPETTPNTIGAQDFDVYSGTGSSATQLGSIHAGETVTNLLGLTNTEFTIIGSTPADGVDASALPATGTVYDVFNLGNGYENIYTATPDVGSTSGTVTDTLVTPSGNVNLDSLFGGINAANRMDPGDAFTGLQAGDSSIGDDAFTLGGYTFDPFTGSGDSAAEGFYTVPSLLSAAPLLNLGGAILPLTPTFSIPLATQDFDVYSGTGSEVGSITTTENVTNLLGLANTEFTITGGTPVDGVDASALPATGTVYDVFNFGNGWENIYIATPGDDGTVTDTLVTPFGNIDLSSLFGSFNAANPLDPSDAVAGLDDAGSAAGTAASDPLAFLGL